jgi:hypothetical protein
MPAESAGHVARSAGSATLDIYIYMCVCVCVLCRHLPNVHVYYTRLDAMYMYCRISQEPKESECCVTRESVATKWQTKGPAASTGHTQADCCCCCWVKRKRKELGRHQATLSGLVERDPIYKAGSICTRYRSSTGGSLPASHVCVQENITSLLCVCVCVCSLNLPCLYIPTPCSADESEATPRRKTDDRLMKGKVKMTGSDYRQQHTRAATINVGYILSLSYSLICAWISPIHIFELHMSFPRG